VTAAGSRNGDFMECQQCYRLYGISYCPSSRDCQTAAGCSYTPPQALGRDDLAATGFIPEGYTFPLKVTFSSITGAGIDTDPVSGDLCPPVTAAQADLVETFNKTMSFKPELFLVLTPQSTLRTAESCDRDTQTTCRTNTICWVDHSVCIEGVCLCQSGYCFDGSACKSNGIGGANSLHMYNAYLMACLILWRFLRM